MTRHIVVLTGQSGSGRSTAMNIFEDLGFYCIDNLPANMVLYLLDRLKPQAQIERIAISLDIRSPNFIEDAPAMLAALRQQNPNLQILFLQCNPTHLLQRYSQTRRSHPLLSTHTNLGHAIAHESKLLLPLQQLADHQIDTSNLTPHALHSVLTHRLKLHSYVEPLQLSMISFGFKHGGPLGVDMMLDVRFLPNPYFVPHLRQGTGLDSEVATYVLQNESFRSFKNHVLTLLKFLLPQYIEEGKSYFTLGIGCTGGQHRSVAIVEDLAKQIQDPRCNLQIRHRDLPNSMSL